ncbi:MAG TPA: cytochrome c [Thermoleophilaceae bacterium]|nr:cytochrome c [Thermoleophilaceae bacterium]
MEAAAFLLSFLLLGGAVLFVAFWGGPGGAREAYLTRGSRLFQVSMVAIYIAFGLVVPALVLANKEEEAGGVGALRSEHMTASEERGKAIFSQTCASCHSLAAVNARGVTGPSLDQIGEVTPERIVNAIENGGTGQGLMPAGLLEGQEAEDVANYVSKVAGSN